VRLLLIRHGESHHLTRDVVAGPRGCPGLTPRGRDQAESLRRRFAAAAAGPDVLFCGSTARARQTADILAPAFGPAAAFVVDCDLCELHPGDADGLTMPESAKRYGSFDWQANPDRQIAPGGESWNQFTARVTRRMHRFAHDHPNGRVVAVTHAGFIVWSVLSLFEIPRPGTGARLDPDFASITEWEYLQHDQAWRLIRFNETTQ
jgi:broad specificity phosphatase PhoE